MSKQSVAAQKATGEDGRFGELDRLPNTLVLDDGSSGTVDPHTGIDTRLQAVLLNYETAEWWGDRIGEFDYELESEEVLTVAAALIHDNDDVVVVLEQAGEDEPVEIDVMVPVETAHRTYYLTDSLPLNVFEPVEDRPGIGNAAHYLGVLTDTYTKLSAVRDQLLAAPKPALDDKDLAALRELARAAQRGWEDFDSQADAGDYSAADIDAQQASRQRQQELLVKLGV